MFNLSDYPNCQTLWRIFLVLCVVVLYCEVIIYYVVLLQCSWPQLEVKNSPAKIMLLADTHLLGRRNGHWFDKLRREWQMYRAFQTAMTLHSPDAVFVLGDLFDEGLWCSDEQFSYYVQRFWSMFNVPEKTKLFTVVGNHDIGFHYGITKPLKDRFEQAFNSTPVQLIDIRGNFFILVNSMAMAGDGCSLCHPADLQLQKIAHFLDCSKGDAEQDCDILSKSVEYSKPFILQHFPMFRLSDEMCSDPDSAPPEVKTKLFREGWECLSRKSSATLLSLVKPRAVFSGHTHYGCRVMHNDNIPEWTIPSFSWRNHKSPSFILASVTPMTFSVSKCYMPSENTVIFIYAISGVGLVLWLVLGRRKFSFRRRKDNR